MTESVDRQVTNYTDRYLAFLVPSDPQARKEALQMLQSIAEGGNNLAQRIIEKAEADKECKGVLYVEVNDDAPLP